MGLADYYDRSATAISQAVAGFDPVAFRTVLSGTAVGVSFGDDAHTPQGQALLDLTIRLLSRLYPTLDIRTAPASSPATKQLARHLRDLARKTNPNISLDRTADTGIAIGRARTPWERTIHAGCTPWTGSISMTRAQAVGRNTTIFGAGISANLAVAAVFRLLITPDQPYPTDTTLNAFGSSAHTPTTGTTGRGTSLPARTILVGAGAVGQACAWTLARTPIAGNVLIVDPETVDLSNLQRYVLTSRADVDKTKAPLTATHINRVGATRGGPRINATAFHGPYADALDAHGHQWDAALAAVDSARDRRAIQATLPAWVANAWTQPGDLGVSDHAYLDGACVACLYLPTGQRPNEDELVAKALGVFPDELMNVRTLLHLGTPVPDGLCDLIAARNGLHLEDVRRYGPGGIRTMYVHGVCGGGLIPLGSHAPVAELHVPLAHQSALAGVLLAARVVRHAIGVHPPTTEVMRLDLSRDLPPITTQSAAKDPRGICLCQDATFVGAYQIAWLDPD